MMSIDCYGIPSQVLYPTYEYYQLRYNVLQGTMQKKRYRRYRATYMQKSFFNIFQLYRLKKEHFTRESAAKIYT